MNQTMAGKPAKAGDYHCLHCENIFKFKEGVLSCPQCGEKAREQLVPVNVKDVKEEELMHTDDDFQGG